MFPLSELVYCLVGLWTSSLAFFWAHPWGPWVLLPSSAFSRTRSISFCLPLAGALVLCVFCHILFIFFPRAWAFPCLGLLVPSPRSIHHCFLRLLLFCRLAAGVPRHLLLCPVRAYGVLFSRSLDLIEDVPLSLGHHRLWVGPRCHLPASTDFFSR